MRRTAGERGGESPGGEYLAVKLNDAHHPIREISSGNFESSDEPGYRRVKSNPLTLSSHPGSLN